MRKNHFLAKIICMTLVSTVLFTACSAQEQTPTREIIGESETTSNNPLDPVQMPIQEEQESDKEEQTEGGEVAHDEVKNQNTVQGTSAKVDIDLTQLSATMVFSQVYDLISNYPDYIGKTVKIYGTIDKFTDIETGEELYAVIINDALGCCPQGIELEFPDDFEIPEWGTSVLIEGSITTIEANGAEFVVIDVYSMIY